MSRLGKKPIKIPEGTTVDIVDGEISVSGKLGKLTLPILKDIDVRVEDATKEILVNSRKKYKQARANWGTMRSLINQNVIGVNSGFLKVLELVGIGFKAALQGNKLVLNIGFSHPVNFTVPENVKVAVEKNIIKVSGINKILVGQVASNIKKLKKPDPYQGKGIRYQGEVIMKKAGKKAVSAGAK